MRLPAKTQHPGRTWYVLFGLSAATVFMLGAAACHALIEADPPGCTMSTLECLFVPGRNDIGVHLVSYALMTPLMAAMFFWFSVWRNQRVSMSKLTGSLAMISARDAQLDRIAASLGLQGKVRLVESEDFLSFCAYFFSPRIFVSRSVVDALNETELEALLLHERYHLDNRDPLRIFVGQSIVSGLFFVPVLRDFFSRYLIRKEIAADQAAILHQGQRGGIVGALRKLLEQDSSGPAGLAVTAGATEELKCRIEFIIGRPNQERVNLSHWLFSSVVPVLAILSIFIPRVILH